MEQTEGGSHCGRKVVSYGALDGSIGKTHGMGSRAFRRRSCRFGGREERSEELWGRKKVRQTGRQASRQTDESGAWSWRK